jgi:4-hydroxy-3-polyprenylbenzoate decarboxylase
MGYASLQECVEDLEKNGHLIRIKEEVDPYLEMAAIHLRVFEKNGPALLFENIKGCEFTAVSNLFGSVERSRFMFRDTIKKVEKLIEIKGDPMAALKQPLKNLSVPFTALTALPRKVSNNPVTKHQTTVSQLPQIQCWPMDGGPFITLPIVYSEDIDKPGVMNSNLGMYRIQLGGNEYIPDKEIGLHYQLHRGIGVHQTKANAKGEPLKVSIFVGGPPSHTFSAVMPLPEGISELTFAGALGGRRFRYSYEDGYAISADADFVITGEVYPGENKPEGPFGDHLGYYSLKHDFPLMKVHKVYHKKGAIWPFTVVGRPPQEDTSFGALIHDMTGAAIPQEIPGLHAVHAVDASGVHPLLFAIGSERYTPYLTEKRPQELLTIANHILGTGQLSLAKYLIIANKADNPELNIHKEEDFLIHVLERIDLSRDLHFHTQTSIDTLDYSGDGLNTGSKVVIAAAGDKLRTLSKEVPVFDNLPDGFSNPRVVLPGVLAFQSVSFTNYEEEAKRVKSLTYFLSNQRDKLKGFPMLLLSDDSEFVSATLNNFLWEAFTRSNPSHDIYGVDEFIRNKHWGVKTAFLLDTRLKPHNAPVLIKDPEVEKRVDRLGEKGGSLYGII